MTVILSTWRIGVGAGQKSRPVSARPRLSVSLGKSVEKTKFRIKIMARSRKSKAGLLEGYANVFLMSGASKGQGN